MTRAASASPVFRVGARGPAVVEVRDRLRRLGLLGTGPTTDEFDDDLDRAVRQFQQQRGLPVDGVVGAVTFRRLEEARWQLGDRVLSFRAGHLVIGDDVAELQQRLLRLGFDIDRVDGIFGRRTDAALREFQRSVGISPDGTCGPTAFRALARLARTMGGAGNALELRHAGDLQGVTTGVADKVVVLDPGSGDAAGPDGLTESELTADLADRVEGRLAAIGVQVLRAEAVPHRTEAVEVERARFANDVAADLVLSLRVARVDSTRPNGLATFYFGDPVTGVGSTLGARAATLVHQELTTRTDLVDCRTHARTWDLLRLTRMPTVQVECGYLSSPDDLARLRDPRFRDAVAEGLASAVVAFFAPD